MRLKLDDPTLFAKSIDMISELVLEVKMRINEFGLSIVAIDPANVSMASLKVPKSSFSEFISGDEILGVNLDSLKKVLKRVGRTASLIIEKKENYIEIKIEDKIKRVFTLNLIEVEGQEKEFPTHLEYKSDIKIPSVDLSDALEDCAVVSDACIFRLADNKFTVESKETNSAKAEFLEGITVSGENSKSRYSLEYLQKFMKAGKSFDFANIHFAEDHPLRMDFKSEAVSLSFLLAPRIETD